MCLLKISDAEDMPQMGLLYLEKAFVGIVNDVSIRGRHNRPAAYEVKTPAYSAWSCCYFIWYHDYKESQGQGQGLRLFVHAVVDSDGLFSPDINLPPLGPRDLYVILSVRMGNFTECIGPAVHRPTLQAFTQLYRPQYSVNPRSWITSSPMFAANYITTCSACSKRTDEI